MKLIQGIDTLEDRKAAEVAGTTFEEAARTVHTARVAGWRNGQHMDQWLTTLEKHLIAEKPLALPAALLHNLTHNKIVHEAILLVSVETLLVPVADADRRISIAPVAPGVERVTIRYGFMELPDVPARWPGPASCQRIAT